MKKFLIFLSAMFVYVSYADTETINWYVDNSVYDTTTCQTGGDVIAPATQPTKYGYTFDGWEVALFDFSTLDYTINGTKTSYLNGMYHVEFPYGTIQVKTKCSVTPGSYPSVGTPDETTTGGTYCWCKINWYRPADSNIIYEPVEPLSWCAVSNTCSVCAPVCATDLMNYSEFRRNMFRTAR